MTPGKDWRIDLQRWAETAGLSPEEADVARELIADMGPPEDNAVDHGDTPEASAAAIERLRVEDRREYKRIVADLLLTAAEYHREHPDQALDGQPAVEVLRRLGVGVTPEYLKLLAP